MAKLSQLNLPVKDESTGVVTDQTFDIGGADYTAGYGIAISNDTVSTKTFTGTTAQWEALTSEQQAAYTFVNITDDSSAVAALSGLDDVTITSPSDGQALVYDGTNNVWVNGQTGESDMICADEFDPENAYAIGDIVTYNRGLYKFKAVHTAQSDWDASEVDEVDVISLIESAEPESLTTSQVNALLALLQ